MRTTTATLLVLIVILGAAGKVGTTPLEIPPLPLLHANDVYPAVPTWKGARVLHIGDSHVSAGLTAGLKKHVREAGARYYKNGWVGSRAKSWVISGQLRKLIQKKRPEVVIVTLGTNAMRDRIPEVHAVWVRALVRKIGPRFCYWVGPPPLLDDKKGFNEMLYENAYPCRYFNSRMMDIPKRADRKFHVTKDQGLDWATHIWRWMNGEIFIEPLVQPDLAQPDLAQPDLVQPDAV